MLSTGRYDHSDRMRELIDDNPQLLMVISRFGIPLGFGDAKVEEVCDSAGVDAPTFLAVANFISHHDVDAASVDVGAMMHYLRRSHAYYLDFIFPSIRRKLIEGVNCASSDEVGLLIIKYFDDYIAEVRAHMEHEEKTVFPYVEELLQGRLDPDYNITRFASTHDHIDARLRELKDIIIRYYPGADCDLLHSALYDIISTQEDLAGHCTVEDRLFVPMVRSVECRLERELSERRAAPTPDEEADAEGRMEQISQREREIIACVARGFSNKEIAAALCISPHTVATHRRNISAKLGVHSPAGLTIFAIIHKLVSLSEVSQCR